MSFAHKAADAFAVGILSWLSEMISSYANAFFLIRRSVMYKIFNILIIYLSLFINNLLFADSKLNEIVITPSLRETTVFDSLSSIEIITREEMQALGHSSINDVLDHSSSINIGSNGGHGQTKSIFLRGTESNHTKVLINGVALNPGTLGVASIQHISVEMIDRVEISKGSMSTLFGRDTIGGVINIITSKNNNSNIVIGTGRDETNKVGINKSISYGLHKLSMNYMKINTDGYKAKVSSTKNHGYKNQNLNIDYEYNYENNNIGLNLYHSDGNTEYDSSGSNLNQDHKDYHAKISWGKRYDSSNMKMIFIDKENKIDQKGASATDYTHTKNNILTIEKNYYDLLSANTLFGFTYTDEALYELSYGTTFRKSNGIKELYSQTEYFINNTLLNLGFRHINHSLYGDFLTGNLNIGHPLDKNMKLIVGIGKSFRSPDGTDLFGYGGNPNLKPEESITREISLKYKVDNISSLVTTYFNTSISNLIESDGSQMQNVNKSKIHGVEISYTSAYKKMNYSLDYTYLKADDLTNNVKLSRRPENRLVGKLNYNIDVMNKISGSFISSSKSDNSIYDSHKLGGYTSFNISYLHDNKDYTIQLKMNNIFDKKYRKAHNYNSEGKSYYLTLKKGF